MYINFFIVLSAIDFVALDHFIGFATHFLSG